MLCQPTEVELEVIVNRINSNDINLQPEFQRGEVWSESKKKKLIDTILRGWKIPPIHMIPDKNKVDEVLDGQQRLAAIRDFYNNEFAVDGSIQPNDKAIAELDGLLYKNLPMDIQREFRRYSITIIRLTEYNPEEPAELFYRLNQPSALTAAEQRNAYIGNTRNQIKELVNKFEAMGAEKEIVGFSNSRLAYDEIISKFAYMIEVNSLKRKITAGDISKRYRDDSTFSDETIGIVEKTLKRYVECMIEMRKNHWYRPKFSKATLISWLLYIACNERCSSEYEELIFRFESSRDYLKNKIQDVIGETYSDFTKMMSDRYPFMEAMLNIYNQRASMGSTDALSIIYRDIIINLFYDMMFNPNSELLRETENRFIYEQNMNAVLDVINSKYIWGDTIR